MNESMAIDKRAIADYWARKPQTYAIEHGGRIFINADNSVVTAEPGSREFFEHADKVLLAWNHPLHDQNPFGRIFPYERYRGKQVLEVGCGQGGMAHMLDHFGPALLQPWTRLTAPELTPRLRDLVVTGVDEFVGDVTVRQLEQQRDDFLADLLLLIEKHRRALLS